MGRFGGGPIWAKEPWEIWQPWRRRDRGICKLQSPLKPQGSESLSLRHKRRAIDAFTSEFSEYAAPNTQKKYKLILAKLVSFSQRKYSSRRPADF